MYYYYEETSSTTRSLMGGVFMWMAVALGLTGLIAYYTFVQPDIRIFLLEHPGVFWGLLIAQLLVVILFSFTLNRISYPTALALFLAYSILTGITLSSIFLIYTMSSIASTFFIAAGMFAAMALYGYLTQADLSSLGSLLMMALLGIIIAMIVNIFLQSPQFNYVISFIAVIVFAGLTAFDIQRIKQISSVMIHDQEAEHKITLVCALTLYLDFINLFLSLLQITGNRNE